MTGGLEFDPVRHVYTFRGARVPSVTEILRETGVSTDFRALADRNPKIAEAIRFKRELGISLHADTHAYDDNDIDLTTVDPAVMPYLQAWMTFRLNAGLDPVTREHRVFHPLYHYAGMLDGIFLRRETGKRVLVDTKTGDPKDAGAQFQTAAYQLAYQCDDPEPVDERWSVWLQPDRAVPYTVTVYNNGRDFADWLAIVRTYWLQAARRKDRHAA